MKHNTVDEREIARFAEQSSDWWNPEGPFKALHWIMPARMDYLTAQIVPLFSKIEGLKILDIGCGGGLTCEALTRLGAVVTGIDADANAIEAAKLHAKTCLSEKSITYCHAAAEDAVRQGNKFDVVCALEILEHVADPAGFVNLCGKLLAPGGLVVFSTLNRTWKSYALGIVLAEQVLHWAPRGTHTFDKFIRPAELARFCRAANLTVTNITGLTYHPLENEFRLNTKDVDVNYFLAATR